MSKVAAVSEALELFVAPFDDEPEAWSDVLRRASVAPDESPTRTRRQRRRLAVLVFAAAGLLALGLSPVGGALARSFGDFSAWLTGSPGEPASENDQRAFDAENERTWARFPDGPGLRRVIATEAAGGTFELFGFRSGDSLCLRLTVEGIPSEEAATGCAPLSELRRARTPALAIHLDAGFGHEDVPRTEEGYIPARASASFGIVADGVEAVELGTSEGRAHAIVENNAFLAITLDPPLGLRTKTLTAIGGHGERASVPLAESPFGDYGLQAKPGVAPGPTAVDRHVEGGTIEWLLRSEPRGRSLAEAGVEQEPFFQRMGTVRYARVLTPDPAGNRHIALALIDVPEGQTPAWSPLHGEVLCYYEFGGGLGGGGCSPLADYFSRGPVSYGTSGSGGEQYAFVSGVASDDVDHMELYLKTGDRMAVALRDNVFVAEVARTRFPARLVAYDRGGRIIEVENLSHDPLADPGPRPVADKQRIVMRVVGANGTKGVVRVGPSTAGTRCHRISFENGAGSSGCLPKGMAPQLALGVLNTGSDSFVTGMVADGTAAIELRFPGGERVVVEVAAGVVAHPLTPAQVARGGPALAIALSGAGEEVGRQRFRRLPP